MNSGIWFQLVKQWKDSGRGTYGLTFPFLIGALAELNKTAPTRNIIEELFDTIIRNPITGFYSEVRWCGNINEPVISVWSIEKLANTSIKDSFVVDNIISLAFTTDLMDMFHLNCDSADECLEKLIDYTFNITKNSLFSKNAGIFTNFSRDDLEFIYEVSDMYHS